MNKKKEVDIVEEYEAGALRLSELDLVKLEFSQLQNQLQGEVIDKLQLQMTLLDIEYTRKRDGLKNKIKDCQSSQTEAKREYNNQIKLIEDRLGIKMNEYIVRDDGMLIISDTIVSGSSDNDN